MDKFDIKIEEEPEKIDIKEDSKSIYKETYSFFDNYNILKSNYINTKKELNISKLNNKTLEEEYKTLQNKYSELQKNDNEEIKKIRKELVEKNKDILMTKTLLELIVKSYGIENVSKTIRLKEEQIRKYLK